MERGLTGRSRACLMSHDVAARKVRACWGSIRERLDGVMTLLLSINLCRSVWVLMLLQCWLMIVAHAVMMSLTKM